jgi:hypothetical protein
MKFNIGLLIHSLFWLSMALVVIGGVLAFIFQYAETMNNEYISSASGNDICHSAYSSYCGVTLSECDSNMEYLCVQNVIQRKTK